MKQFNIYHRKDGRWEGRIPDASECKKSRKYTAFYGHSREEVAAKMNNFQISNTVFELSLTFTQLYQEWLAANRYRIKESTAANYIMKASKHLLPVFGNLQVTDISDEMINRFIYRKQIEHLSNRYITDILVLMKSIFRFGEAHYQLLNPMHRVAMPKKHRTEVTLLTEAEQAKLEMYIAAHHDRTTLGIALARATGLRIGELCALQWMDVDLKKRILTVRKTVQRIQKKNGNRKTTLVITDPKTETSYRQIPIPEFLIGFLREFQGGDSDYVLSGTGKPIEPRTMQYRFVRVLKNAKLPSVHFHSLRHSFASNCIRLGFDIKALSEILGHSSVEITLNRYVHSSFEQKTEYMNRLKAIV